jgi:hypothetical protein
VTDAKPAAKSLPPLIGTKMFAYDVSSGERVWANEAAKRTPYRLPEGYCSRVDDAGGCYFRFYPDDWHKERDHPQRPGFGGGESSVHDAAVEWIKDNLRVGVAFEGSPLYLRFSEAVNEFWTGERRPDVRALVESCWPAVLSPGDVVYVEVCLASKVTPERKIAFEAEGIATIEIVLDRDLLKPIQPEELERIVRTELVRCPFGHWIVGPRGKPVVGDGRVLYTAT